MRPWFTKAKCGGANHLGVEKKKVEKKWKRDRWFLAVVNQNSFLLQNYSGSIVSSQLLNLIHILFIYLNSLTLASFDLWHVTPESFKVQNVLRLKELTKKFGLSAVWWPCWGTMFSLGFGLDNFSTVLWIWVLNC